MLALAWVLLLAAGARAAQNASGPVITTVGEFWNLPESARREPLPVRMEMVVNYYDPYWKLLYCQTGAEVSYLPTGGAPLAIKSGQKVRLEGTVIAADGFDGERIRTTVLADNMLPEPVSVAGRMEDPALNGHWVWLEGYVLSQQEPDATHVEARVWSEGHFLTMTVQISATEPVPQLVGALIRAQGVYDVGRDSEGQMQKIEFWTAHRDRIEVKGAMADDERFALPRTPIERLEQSSVGTWVRLAGEVKSQEPGASLTVRDETGQIEIPTKQPETLPVGATVEIFGRATPSSLGWTLRSPLFRRVDAPALAGQRPGNAPLRLRLAEQVLQLSPAEAAKAQPVTLRGIVTWSDEASGNFYLQDVSGGILIRRSGGILPGFGQSVTVTGFTARGKLHAEVEMSDVLLAGSLALPPPRKITLDQAMTGAEAGRWVEMSGYLRQVVSAEGRTHLDLTGRSGEFTAIVPRDAGVEQLQGSLLRVRGVCVAVPGANGELSGIQVLLQNRDALVVDVPGTLDPFATGLQTIADLRQPTVAPTSNQRARVSGIVTLQQPGRYLYMQDGDAGLFVLTRETRAVAPGTRIELVGLVGRAGNRMVLREGIWRVVAEGVEVVPADIESVEPVDLALDTRLVRTRAVLRQAGQVDSRWVLSLETGSRIFEGTLPADAAWQPPEAGSRLELTGVHVVEFDEYRQPHGVRLELRGPADIVLLSRPSWWSVQRTFYVAGGLAILALMIFSWGITLRRRVRAQTEQIRLQLDKEKRLQAELERTTRLESLGVLAGGIAHDFNNLLTAILGNLGLAAMDKRVMAAAGDCIAEAERGARRARDITQQLLTFARGGDPVRTAVPLPEIVTEAANFARHGSKVRFDFDLPSNLPPGNVDAGQISRVVHNLVLNAVQAMPDGGVVNISLAAAELRAGEIDALPAGSYLRLTIADTGRGIPPEDLTRIFDPYYSTKGKVDNSGLGLATVHSIVKKHKGHIELESEVGRGSTFRVWLPAAPHEMPATAATTRRAAAFTPARILVMDDEEVIRRVAGRMLALAGHEAVFASDGAEAIRSYAAARQSGRPFDLVIFDLTVPGGMGGKDALQELLKMDPEVRAIASSGYSSDAVMANPREYGFWVSLPKPYDIPDLMRAVEEARRP